MLKHNKDGKLVTPVPMDIVTLAWFGPKISPEGAFTCLEMCLSWIDCNWKTENWSLEQVGKHTWTYGKEFVIRQYVILE